MSWRVARSLDVLLEEINAAAPRRSKISDGSIGDAAHASRDSDHNPWVVFKGQGIVRARDFTHDPAGGLDCNELAKALAALIAVGGHPACRSGAYVIWNRRIFSFDRRGEGWRAYTGSNPHDHHCHISVALDPAGFDSAAPWFVMTERDWFDMASKADLEQVVDAAADRIIDRDNERAKNDRTRQRERDKKFAARLEALEQELSDDATPEQIRKMRADIRALREAVGSEES